MELNPSDDIQEVNAKSPISGVVLTNEIVLAKTRCQSLDAIKRLNCWCVNNLIFKHLIVIRAFDHIIFNSCQPFIKGPVSL